MTTRPQATERRPAKRPTAGVVPPAVYDVLREPGAPLDAATRAYFEPRFGADFGGVRVHTGSKAAAAAAAVNGRAYTVGTDVVLGEGARLDDRGLVAHELTHVLQQGAVRVESTHRLAVGPVGGGLEAAADRAARSMSDPRPRAVSVRTATAPLVQRQPTAAGLQPFPTAFDPEPPARAASAAGSLTLDAFALDRADLTAEHQRRLLRHAATMTDLLRAYPDSFVTVVGHTDATGSEAHNQPLGRRRADAVLEALAAAGVPREVMHAASLGESVLAVETHAQEPRNRRVEVNFTARGRAVDLTPGLRAGAERPSITPGPSPRIDTGVGNPCVINPALCRPDPKPGDRKSPDFKRPQPEWLKDALEHDPIVRTLPKDVRDLVVDALKDADETAAEKIIDALPIDDRIKGPLQAIVKAGLKAAKGKKFEVPNATPKEIPPSTAPTMPRAPGETIIPGPKIKF